MVSGRWSGNGAWGGGAGAGGVDGALFSLFLLLGWLGSAALRLFGLIDSRSVQESAKG